MSIFKKRIHSKDRSITNMLEELRDGKGDEATRDYSEREQERRRRHKKMEPY